MALNGAAPTEDPIHQTAIKRQFPRSLVGDLTFDRERDNHRDKVLLSRNMTRVLAFHEKNRAQQTDFGGRTSSRRRLPYLGNSSVKGQSNYRGAPTLELVENPVSIDGHGEVNSPTNEKTSDTPISELESMSKDCLKVKAKMEKLDTNHRRSLRRQLFNQHEDKDAQLTLDICNIRKKLNFKEHVTPGDKRPRKRTKRDSIQCHCHVTIWDNRHDPKSMEQEVSLFRHTEPCEVTASALDDGNYSIDIELANPFVIKSTQLRVPVKGPNGTVLALSERYFLEIKIIPTRDYVQWPPIPILGRSEGDQITGLGQLAAEKLQGTLVMKYYHLPQAPDADTPLSVYYLKDGILYRSKYGVEVRSIWTRPGSANTVKKEIEDDKSALWKIDDENRLFGKPEPAQPVVNTRESDLKELPPIKVTFNFDSVGSREAKEFRKATLRGLQCPTCSKQSFDALEQLQFHFMTNHSKYKFLVDKEIREPITERLISVSFKVTPASVPKTRSANQHADKRTDGELNWTAPAEPFDLHEFIAGDQKWVPDPAKKKAKESGAQVVVVKDKLSSVRTQHAGFLPAEHVPPFRPAQRSKFPVVKLNTLAVEKSIPYTSVSVRQRQLSEEPQSETDDEVDCEPYVQKSLENLDVSAERNEWGHEERMLRSKWNRARFVEQLSHPRYLSDCLVRFVRTEKEWLSKGGTKVQLALSTFLKDLLVRRVINNDTVRDIWSILHSATATTTAAVTTTTASDLYSDHDVTMEDASALADQLRVHETQDASRQARVKSIMALPDMHCGICAEYVSDVEFRGLHCSDAGCEAPGVWYHTKCVRCKIRDKLGWKCSLCIERIHETEDPGVE